MVHIVLMGGSGRGDNQALKVKRLRRRIHIAFLHIDHTYIYVTMLENENITSYSLQHF